MRALQTVGAGVGTTRARVKVGSVRRENRRGERTRVSESVEREQRVSDDYLVAPEQDAPVYRRAKCGEIDALLPKRLARGESRTVA